MSDTPTPRTDSCFGSADRFGNRDVVPAKIARQLERELAEANERHLYWKGVVRGARFELHQADRITNEEYAALCADSDCRDYVDSMDVLRDKLAAAQERIRRLEEAGDEIAFRLRESVFTEDEVAIEEWDHAKEAKQ